MVGEKKLEKCTSNGSSMDCLQKKKKKRICKGLKKLHYFPILGIGEIHEVSVLWLALPLGWLSREAAAFPPRRSCARQGK